MTVWLRVAVSVFVGLALAACNASPGASTGISGGAFTPSGPGSPVAALAAGGSPAATPAPPVASTGSVPASLEPLPSAMSGTHETLTCGGMTFPRSALDAPSGAQHRAGPEYDALRAALAQFAAEFPGAGTWPWQLVAEDATGATFLARTDALGAPGWVSVEAAQDSSGWHMRTIGQCNLSVLIAPGLGPAHWALDPAYPAPGPASTELHVLVWELQCNGGYPLTGRIGPPVIDYGASTVTITLGGRPLGGVQTCPGSRGTPAIVRLSGPLGSRTLQDGGTVPAAAPSPMF